MRFVKSLLVALLVADLSVGIPSFGAVAETAPGEGNNGRRELDEGRAGTVPKGRVPFANSEEAISATNGRTRSVSWLSIPYNLYYILSHTMSYYTFISYQSTFHLHFRPLSAGGTNIVISWTKAMLKLT